MAVIAMLAALGISAYSIVSLHDLGDKVQRQNQALELTVGEFNVALFKSTVDWRIDQMLSGAMKTGKVLTAQDRIDLLDCRLGLLKAADDATAGDMSKLTAILIHGGPIGERMTGPWHAVCGSEAGRAAFYAPGKASSVEDIVAGTNRPLFRLSEQAFVATPRPPSNGSAITTAAALTILKSSIQNIWSKGASTRVQSTGTICLDANAALSKCVHSLPVTIDVVPVTAPKATPLVLIGASQSSGSPRYFDFHVTLGSGERAYDQVGSVQTLGAPPFAWQQGP